jgi:trigger factor
VNVELTKLPESQVTLAIELAPAEVDQSLERTYRRLVQRLAIPGFRKGKAPRSVVERHVGLDSFLHEATDDAINWGYRKALEEHQLVPLTEASVQPGDEHEHMHPDTAFLFEATVTVRPEVQLPDYHSIRIDVPESDVTEEEVKAVIGSVREKNATWVPTVRPAQLGDTLTMNLTAISEGQTILSDENYDFELMDEAAEGATLHSELPQLAAEMVGVNRGEIREASLHLPDEYTKPELAGKLLIVRTLVKEIKRRQLPDLDDEFAQSVSSVATMQELRELIRANLTAEHVEERQRKIASDAVDAVVGATFLDIPAIMVDEEVDSELGRLEDMFKRQGLSLEEYYRAVNRNEADMRQEFRDPAAKTVKTSLVLNAVADAEDIRVDEKEIDDAVDVGLRYSDLSQPQRRKARASQSVRARIRGDLRRQRAIRALVHIVSGEDTESDELALSDAAGTTRNAEEASLVLTPGSGV